MEWIKEWWAQLIVLGGIVLGILRYLFAHGKKHQEIDARLKWGVEHFEQNDKDHADIKEALGEGEKKLNAAVTGVKELLVHEGLRKPGQSINGED